MYRKREWIGALLITGLLMTPAARSADQDPTALQGDPVPARVEGNTRFALDLYARLKEEKGNLLVSPFSISMTLAMAWAGAEGETERQMAGVLHFTRPGEEEHEAFSRLGSVPATAQALWIRKDLALMPDYLACIRKYYKGEAHPVDFLGNLDSARIAINNWAGEKTGGCIRKLIGAEDLNTVTDLVLTNALWFKENWAFRFDPEHTKLQSFTVSPGETTEVPTMYQRGRFHCVEGGDLRILRLPFAGGDRSMVILLPGAPNGLPALEGLLTAENLEDWMAGWAEEEVTVFLPRFSVTSRFLLEECLASLGMPDAFSPERADFSRMTGKKDLFIHRVIHQAFLKVDEAGVEAAAATAATMRKGGQVFRVDHPFLFLVRDDKTGSLLFMGRVMNPAVPEE